MKQMSLRFVFRMALGLFVTVLAALPVRAVPVIGLTQSNSLISFDTATPGITTAPIPVTGLVAGQTLVGIDFRPATGQLYGLGSSVGGVGSIYVINPTTGAAILVGTLNDGVIPSAVLLNGTSFGVDFNPTVDRLRIVSDADQNLRVNPGNAVTIVDTTVGGGVSLVGVAYGNNFSGATSTVLWALDYQTNSLLRATNPNGGVYVSVGNLGVNFFIDNEGFDIFGETSAFASLNTGGAATGFYSVNLSTGAATLVGDIGGGLLLADISISSIAEPEAQVPLPSTIALLGLGLAGIGWSRLRK